MSIRKSSAIRYSDGRPMDSDEELTWEEALQVKINGRPYTVTMRTPGNDTMLAVGLLLSEGIISSPGDILSIREVPTPSGELTLSVDVEIREEIILNKNIFNRSIASTASCGVCGKADICDLVAPIPLVATSKKLRTDLIPEMQTKMRKRQATFERSGGSHAASILTVNGDLLSVQEDIGRHNAVDKAIGELFLNDSLQNADVLFISGRVSYEIVAKCTQAKIPFLLAVSAPSSLAVEHCKKSGITLIGFCRDRRFTVYSHSENIENDTWKMVNTQ
ncbi:MAG TPA: formate dehydrogenase accessory sulfurtransferase FdhD [Cyclobacteriaceae bacterium]|nr:formate dehydrogenase accessory sulfurtransferase FdhD [Cyclobacteriaceae bacterium]